MNDLEDVKKQLEVKNKEIYLNKLNFDLDNNLEVLILTIDNLLNTMTNEIISKVLEIDEGFINKNKIELIINNFIDLYRNNLLNNFETKRKKIIDLASSNFNIDICIKDINDYFPLLQENVNKFYLDNVLKVELELRDLDYDEFKIRRLNEYLNNILFSNLNNKVFNSVKTRDIILINTLKETYLKYLELNKNTIG